MVISAPKYTVENVINGKSHVVTSKEKHIVCGVEVVQEWDDFSQHRLSSLGVVGEWSGYEFPCVIHTQKGSFCGTTDYWEGTFPPVFQIRTRRRGK